MKELHDIKGILIGASVFVAVILAMVIAIIILRKRNAASAPAVLPSETDWGKTLTEAESSTVKRIADALYNDLKGVGWTRNNNIYIEYSQVSDRIFVGVANYFAEQYGKGESLYEWIDSEWWLMTGTMKTSGTVDAIKMRLLSFNLK